MPIPGMRTPHMSYQPDRWVSWLLFLPISFLTILTHTDSWHAADPPICCINQTGEHHDCFSSHKYNPHLWCCCQSKLGLYILFIHPTPMCPHIQPCYFKTLDIIVAQPQGCGDILIFILLIRCYTLHHSSPISISGALGFLHMPALPWHLVILCIKVICVLYF